MVLLLLVSCLLSSQFIAECTFADIYDIDYVLTKFKQFPKHRWEEFGLECGLYYNTLEIIQDDNPRRTEKCFIECVVRWLRREDDVDKKGKPTLQRLADIVGKVHCDRLTQFLVSGIM